MKLYRVRSISVLIAALLCLSCTKEEDRQGRLVVGVHHTLFTDCQFARTKASNEGTITTFEVGDAIGITAIDAQGSIIQECNNVKFTLDNDGTTWLRDGGFDFVEKYDGARYFAYYPWSSDWNNKTLSEIESEFTPNIDQSTSALYNQSDLMMVDAAVSPGTEDVTFVLKHKMSLISMLYSNEFTPEGDPMYEISMFSSSTPSDIDNTYFINNAHRYLVKPGAPIRIKGLLVDENRFFSKEITPVKGYLHPISFIGEPLVTYNDAVDLELDSILGYTLYWSKYNLGESTGQTYPYAPLDGDIGTQQGSKNEKARGDYYNWGSTHTQYTTGYAKQYYFDPKFTIAPVNGTIRGTEYDVAHAIWWRGKWRLPTDVEFEALIAGCTITLESTQISDSNYRYDGQITGKQKWNVYKATSNTNPEKFIYFAGGGYANSTINSLSQKQDGFYLTSSAGTKAGKCSYMRFREKPSSTSGKYYEVAYEGDRYTGMNVRPVYCPSE